MTIAKIYAEGFLEYASLGIGFQRGLDELLTAKSILGENPDFLDLLENPSIPENDKFASVENIFAGDFSEDFRNFVKMLIRKDRMGVFFRIAEYARIKYSHGDEINVVANSSYQLDMDKASELKAALEKRLGKKTHLYFNLDPDLLGGIRVMAGNLVIDGSVKKRLEDLKEKMVKAKV
jgi:F-type H+-transporting ATPase subunit delta